MYLKKAFKTVDTLLENEIERLLNGLSGGVIIAHHQVTDFAAKAVQRSRGSTNLDLRLEMIQWYEYPSQALAVAIDQLNDLSNGNEPEKMKRVNEYTNAFLKNIIDKKNTEKKYPEMITEYLTEIYLWIKDDDLPLSFKIEMLESYNDYTLGLVLLLQMMFAIDRDGYVE